MFSVAPVNRTDGPLDLILPPPYGAAMDRRRFLRMSLAGVLVAHRMAEAQQAAKLFRIGLLETRSSTLNAANVETFRQGMQQLGYKEGLNFEILYRSSDGNDQRFPSLAAELVGLNVDVVVTRGTPAAQAARNASRTTPVVMAASGDPERAGLVASLARPGGNITGLSSGLTDAYAKRVELLRDLLPRLVRIAAIFNMANRAAPPQWDVVAATARALGLQSQLLDVRQPDDLPRLFEAAAQQRAEALIVGLDGVTQGNLRLIAERAAKQQLPSIYPEKAYVILGGLMTYGASDLAMYHRAATFVDRILKGAKPADLPVEQPTKFELAINMKTAKALGLTIPPSLLLRADHVIE
jgi:putative tryptophan/tyrosine transport system substrate-binding protein